MFGLKRLTCWNSYGVRIDYNRISNILCSFCFLKLGSTFEHFKYVCTIRDTK